MKVVCNSGPLMALSKIGQIHLLYPVYGVVLTPVDAVRQNILSLSDIDVIFDALLKREDIWIAESLIRRVWKELKTKSSS